MVTRKLKSLWTLLILFAGIILGLGLTSCGEKGFKKFRCVGMEPFWTIMITDYNHLTYYAPGTQEIWKPAQTTIIGEQFVYQTFDSANLPVKIIIHRQVCNDSMSETVYQYSVTLEKNGKVFRGCGEVQE